MLIFLESQIWTFIGVLVTVFGLIITTVVPIALSLKRVKITYSILRVVLEVNKNVEITFQVKNSGNVPLDENKIKTPITFEFEQGTEISNVTLDKLAQDRLGEEKQHYSISNDKNKINIGKFCLDPHEDFEVTMQLKGYKRGAPIKATVHIVGMGKNHTIAKFPDWAEILGWCRAGLILLCLATSFTMFLFSSVLHNLTTPLIVLFMILTTAIIVLYLCIFINKLVKWLFHQ